MQLLVCTYLFNNVYIGNVNEWECHFIEVRHLEVITKIVQMVGSKVLVRHALICHLPREDSVYLVYPAQLGAILSFID